MANFSSQRAWCAVATVCVGTFLLVCSELAPVALLPDIASSLGISAGQAAWIVSIPGVVAAFSAPWLIGMTGRIGVRGQMLGSMALLALANALLLVEASVATLASRLVLGVGVGCFWSLAAPVGMRLAPPAQVGRAIALIFAGASAATVIGVPLAAALSHVAGWHAVARDTAMACALLLVAQAWVLPPLPSASNVSLSTVRRAFAMKSMHAVLGTTLLVVMGQFCAYTYFTSTLLQSLGMTPAQIDAALWIFGAGCVAGPFVLARWASVSPGKALVGAILGMTVAAEGVLWAGHSNATAYFAIAGWGLCWGTVPTSLQLWTLKAVPMAPELGSALFVSIFQMAIGLGATLGGQAVYRLGVSWATTGAVVLWIVAVIALRTRAADPRSPRAPDTSGVHANSDASGPQRRT